MKNAKVIKAIFGTLLVLVVLSITPRVSAFDVPTAPTNFVNDYAQILSPAFENALNQRLQEVATATYGAELVVVALPSLEGETIEGVSQQFFDTWKIGQEKLDNGVLLLVAINDRKMRVQAGYGVEQYLTDAQSGRIIREQIAPQFKKENYEAGIQAGVDAILLHIEHPDEVASEPVSSSSELTAPITSVLFALMIFLGSSLITYGAAYLGRTKSWWLGGLIGLVLGLVTLKVVVGVILGIFGLLLDYILSKNYKIWKIEQKATNWKSTWGGFKSSSSGSSSGFGGFSGGSSGGGGASGSW